MRTLAVNHARLWLALAAGCVIVFAAPSGWSLLTRLLTGWNGAVLLLLALTYVWTSRLDANALRTRYEEDDPTAPVILLVVVAAAVLSIAAIVALLASIKSDAPSARAWFIFLATLTIVDSWLLVPLVFTLHYADAFYSAPRDAPPLSFPNTKEPLFWDFVYFSFTIAAACQTADVQTNDVAIRKMVVIHSVISLLFNVSILGFAVNVSAGLTSGS